ncbi:MAG: lipopolysaccharide heptosyltransferase I, partial [Acidobacteriota bacterium]|nr:lipopolysaccharide heptosyltransferase I [Acidobacteriota bacterium]
MRLLMVKLSSIGDIVHTLPTLAAIRSALPEAEISWAVERTSAEILRNNPLLTRLIEVDTRSLRRKSVLGKTIMTARKQLRNLRASDFDLAIDFQGLIKSASISRFSGARYRAGDR